MSDAEQQNVASSSERLNVPVSVGELVNKITILRIKERQTRDATQLSIICRELAVLSEVLQHGVQTSSALDQLTEELTEINKALLRIKDDIGECEARKDFGERFVELAQGAYRTGDRQSNVMRQIDQLLGSSPVKKESHTDSTASQAVVERPIIDSRWTRIRKGRHGLMAYNPHDRFIGKSLDCYGEFSELETDLFRQILRPGFVVVEAGANVGTHTLPIARLVGDTGEVHAFEPQRLVFYQLCTNMAINDVVNAHCYLAALGAEQGFIRVPVLAYDRQNNFGGLELGQNNVGEMITLRTIDSLRLQRCDFVKIDVEGMELQVLQGATETIRQHKPILYVENDRESKSADLIRYISSLDYNMYWHVPPLFNPQNHFQNKTNVFENIGSINMLCLHTSTPTPVTGFRQVEGPESTWR